MGGRGSKSSYGDGGVTTGDSGRKLTFYDKTDKFKGMTIQEFEDAIRDRKHEYIGIADENGKIIIAGTSYNKGAVAVPTTHPDFKKGTDLTHNHPYQGGRGIGGSFSGADVRNHVMFGLKSTRATSKEKTYIVRGKNTTSAQTKRLARIAEKADNVFRKNANSQLKRVIGESTKRGRRISSLTESKVYLGYSTRLWKNLLGGNSGYEYIEIKAKNRK